jgi:diacylglycerol O-acyltransferase
MQRRQQARMKNAAMLPSDAFFWYAEAAVPQLRPLVAGLFLLEHAPDRRLFRKSVQRLVACFPRLRQRVVEAPRPLDLPRWSEDESFDLDYHLRDVVLPEPATARHLFDLAGALFAAPLDHLRPLWEAYLIAGLQDGRAALLLKMHHSVVDGVGSVGLFEALTQAQAGDVIRLPGRRSRGRELAARSTLDSFWSSASTLAEIGRGGVQAALNPRATLEELGSAARGLGRMIGDFNRRATDPLAARSTGIGRRLDGVAFSLPRMWHVKEALDVTLNDLVLTVIAGAAGRYHEYRKIRLSEVACVVPVSVRRPGDYHLPGNHVTAFHVNLPVRERDPLIRLERIRALTKVAKGDGRKAASRLLMNVVSVIPSGVFRWLTRAASGRIHLICSNVPGPPAHRFLAGAKIDAVYPFAPLLLGIPLSIAVVSYGDSLLVGIDSDPAAIPDTERIGQYIQKEFKEIERRALPRRLTSLQAPRVLAEVPLAARRTG